MQPLPISSFRRERPPRDTIQRKMIPCCGNVPMPMSMSMVGNNNNVSNQQQQNKERNMSEVLLGRPVLKVTDRATGHILAQCDVAGNTTYPLTVYDRDLFAQKLRAYNQEHNTIYTDDDVQVSYSLARGCFVEESGTFLFSLETDERVRLLSGLPVSSASSVAPAAPSGSFGTLVLPGRTVQYTSSNVMDLTTAPPAMNTTTTDWKPLARSGNKIGHIRGSSSSAILQKRPMQPKQDSVYIPVPAPAPAAPVVVDSDDEEEDESWLKPVPARVHDDRIERAAAEMMIRREKKQKELREQHLQPESAEEKEEAVIAVLKAADEEEKKDANASDDDLLITDDDFDDMANFTARRVVAPSVVPVPVAPPAPVPTRPLTPGETAILSAVNLKHAAKGYTMHDLEVSVMYIPEMINRDDVTKLMQKNKDHVQTRIKRVFSELFSPFLDEAVRVRAERFVRVYSNVRDQLVKDGFASVSIPSGDYLDLDLLRAAFSAGGFQTKTYHDGMVLNFVASI